MGKGNRAKNRRKDEEPTPPPQESSRRELLKKAGIAAVVLSPLAYFLRDDSQKSPSPEVAAPPSHQTLENIAFADAKRNPSLRQMYCTFVYDHRQQFGYQDSWDSFAAIEYDPGLQRLRSIQEQRFPGRRPSNSYNDPDQLIILANTPWITARGTKSTVWVSEAAFEYLETDDEFFSLMDNEASSSVIWERQQSHLDIDTSLQPQDIAHFYRAIELISLDNQFMVIDRGRRQVRPYLLGKLQEESKPMFRMMVELARENSQDGRYAAEVVRALRATPRRHYFE